MKTITKYNILGILTALLSSSCCVIQLVLNFFSVSCAGFAVFTPYRPVLTTISFVLISYSLYNKGFKNRQAILILLVCILLMVSPEIVKYINQQEIIIEGQDSISYHIKLEGLGCEGCANRVKNTLNSIDWITENRVYFNNKTAIVKTNKVIDVQLLIESIEAIDSKYKAQLVSSWK